MKWEPTKAVLNAWKELLAGHPTDTFTEEEFLKIQDEVKNKTGAKGKNLFMPIRVAVIGKPHGAELKTLIPLMTKKSLIARAETALAQA
ncbi:Glutamate--tRNA ligase [compost metagenome]